MNTRILPRDEWGKLEKTKIPPFLGLPPEDVSVVVVEDDEELIAAMTVLRLTHYEGAWIDQRWSGNLGVTRTLLRHAEETARQWTDGAVIAGAEEGPAGDQMRGILLRLGGTRLPLEFYALPLGGIECRKQS